MINVMSTYKRVQRGDQFSAASSTFKAQAKRSGKSGGTGPMPKVDNAWNISTFLVVIVLDYRFDVDIRAACLDNYNTTNKGARAENGYGNPLFMNPT